jgi:antitoxin component YwqK of YwqJK toxin-antitoxin module
MKKYVLIVLAIATVQSITAQDKSNTTGEQTAYNADGSKSAIYNLKKGLADGAVAFFYEGGIKKEEGAFLNGNRDGKWLKWDEKSGELISEAYYVDGKKDGDWKIWDENGVLRYEMFYDQGKKIGTWKQYDASGKLMSEKKQ